MPHPTVDALDPADYVALRRAIEEDYVAGRVVVVPDGWIVPLIDALTKDKRFDYIPAAREEEEPERPDTFQGAGAACESKRLF